MGSRRRLLRIGFEVRGGANTMPAHEPQSRRRRVRDRIQGLLEAQSMEKAKAEILGAFGFSAPRKPAPSVARRDR
jgi:hypothetical protein